MSDAVADELAIRHLVSAYADAVNRRDKALWASTWAEESVWDLSAFSAEGKANICLLYTSPSPRDLSTSRMPSSA